jgi:hypothetical protein
MSLSAIETRGFHVTLDQSIDLVQAPGSSYKGNSGKIRQNGLKSPNFLAVLSLKPPKTEKVITGQGIWAPNLDDFSPNFVFSACFSAFRPNRCYNPSILEP